MGHLTFEKLPSARGSRCSTKVKDPVPSYNLQSLERTDDLTSDESLRLCDGEHKGNRQKI